ncbi:hypothetical protein C6341_g19929 [Phytophthora cactorum]|nr:hypothetical protein C6341_g19929 [Phytophthora cactorum]
MEYLNKCDMVAKSNTTAIPADYTASSPAESSQRRPHQLPATVSSPPRSLGKTSSGIVGVSPHDNTIHTASDLAAISQGSRISGRKRAQAFEESSERVQSKEDSADIGQAAKGEPQRTMTRMHSRDLSQTPRMTTAMTTSCRLMYSMLLMYKYLFLPR